MGGIFTKKAARRPAPPPKAAISDRDKAVYDLKVQRDRLKKFIVKVFTRVDGACVGADVSCRTMRSSFARRRSLGSW